jgi:hypothetical protein
MRRAKAGTGLSVLLLLAAPASAADLEAALAGRWRGAWVVLGSEAYSHCDAGYSNNQVAGRRVSGKGAVRLDPGELGKVYKVTTARSRVDVLIDLEESLLLPFRDGPFELLNEVHCKVELQFEVPREVVRGGDVAAAEAALAQVLERFDDRAGAQRSPHWNRRQRAPYPDDYEETLAEYRVWKAQQTNAAVAARIDRAVDDAAEAAERMRAGDAAYVAGFAAGVEEMDHAYYGDCPSLLSAAFWSAKKSPPGDRKNDRAFCDGFDDGQLLAWSLELARRLRACYVPTP